MLAHQLSVSKPPSKPKPKVGKQQQLRQAIEQVFAFVVENLGTWCLVGVYTVKEHGTRAQAYAKMHYQADKLSQHIAMMLTYDADAYPISWEFKWNKSKAQYEVRMLMEHKPEAAYGYVEPQSVERKQVSALKTAMDSLFFGGQS
jgi:hypothetical protein